MGRKDNDSNPKKTSFGAWMMKAFAGLAKLKVLRGTMLDIIGYSAERRIKRKLITNYEALIIDISANLTS